MKKIKPIVLKDAKKLTSDEMKNIRGGVYVNSSSTTCSATCAPGAPQPFLTMDCSRIPEATCGIEYNGHETIIACFNMDGHKLSIEKNCNNPLPPLEYNSVFDINNTLEY